MEKCKTFFEKALASDANCTDVFIHRARVSIVDQINFISSPSFFASFFYLSFSLSLPCSLLSSTSLSLLRLPHPPLFLYSHSPSRSPLPFLSPSSSFSFLLTQLGLESEDPQGLNVVSEDLEKAVKMAPNFPYASYSLASTYHRIAGLLQSVQTLELARDKFEEAVKKFPNYVDGLVLYALVSVKPQRRVDTTLHTQQLVSLKDVPRSNIVDAISRSTI